MRAIWKGSISFGLVNIPVALFPATRREELKFQLLRATDLSPINYKRVAEADGQEVAWDQIVKGYQYEKGKFVVLREEDFARVDLEATQTVEITDFVELAQVNPMFFHKPYFMEPQKGGDKPYALLREALKESEKIGIAKVVIKTRQYLAAVKPQDDLLILELMHFADELIEAEQIKVAEREVGKKEKTMALALIESMTGTWDPHRYRDEYREALEKVVQDKIEHPEHVPEKKGPAKRSLKVIDLVAVLQESLNKASARKTPTEKNPRRKKAA